MQQLMGMIEQADGDIEMVVGGGVSHENMPTLSKALCVLPGQCSFHAYSAVLENRRVSANKVQKLRKLVSLDG